MKVKIFREDDEPLDPQIHGKRCAVPMEQRINDFIQNKDVIDIKYQSSFGSDWIEQALVMYNDKKENKQ